MSLFKALLCMPVIIAYFLTNAMESIPLVDKASQILVFDEQAKELGQKLRSTLESASGYQKNFPEEWATLEKECQLLFATIEQLNSAATDFYKQGATLANKMKGELPEIEKGAKNLQEQLDAFITTAISHQKAVLASKEAVRQQIAKPIIAEAALAKEQLVTRLPSPHVESEAGLSLLDQ